MTPIEPNGGETPSARRFSWWSILLVMSLALNFLFIGAAAARYFVSEPPGRMAGISEMQLIPRKFFGDLSHSRRNELLSVFRGFRGEFRDGREARRQLAAALADALEASPYDEVRVREAVLAFNGRSSELMARGGAAALDFIAKLNPEEKKLLAGRIRERVSGGRKHKDKDDDKDKD